ncbi:glycosyltransferase family 4 protein [Nitrospinae bacterium AH_259_B05_G02_I21]|nr:glycosyltransferase family 4 protein [Nitrospinae bacterium AH_259_B05_G02_I21]MDA2931702.1 glycosyltransferase family 4 protein [Nitrospinae bacterium AH-259-F20]
MNILLSPVSYLPQRSGVPIIVQNLAKAFVRMGHNVIIVTPKLDQAHPSFEIIDGIEVHRMPFVFPWRLLWQRPKESRLQFCLRCPTDIQRLVRLMDKKQIEIIDIHSLTGPHLPYMIFAKLFSNRPFVVTLQGNDFLQLNTQHSRMRRMLLRYSLRRAEQITAVSSHVASEAARFWPEVSGKIVTIPNSVAVDEFGGPACFPFPSPYLLSLARLNPLKGHDVLLTAFRRIAEREKNIHLIIAGDGPQKIRLHAITLALGLKDRVTFLGEVGRERVKELLAGCEFLVLPSWNEGIPVVALEAMASRKAVVSTHVGGVPEIVSHSETGLLVPPGDPNSLAEAMLSLLQNRDQCKAMGDRGRAFVKDHHDFTQTIDRYLDVYRKALLQANGNRMRQKEKPDL